MVENEECLNDMCAVKDMVVEGSWFKKNLTNKCTWEHDSCDTRSMIGHVVVYHKLMKNTRGVIVLTRAGDGVSNHYLLPTKVKLTDREKYRRQRTSGKCIWGR